MKLTEFKRQVNSYDCSAFLLDGAVKKKKRDETDGARGRGKLEEQLKREKGRYRKRPAEKAREAGGWTETERPGSTGEISATLSLW